MPLAGEKTAPKFDPKQPRSLARYFTTLETLFQRAALPTNEHKHRACLYVPIDVEDDWQSLPEYDDTTKTYDEWKVEVFKLYPGADSAARYTRAGLRNFVVDTSRRTFRTLGEWAEFSRQYHTMSHWLTAQGKISGIDCKIWCADAIGPAMMQQLETRLITKYPDVHPSDGYNVTQLDEAMRFQLQGTALNTLPAPSSIAPAHVAPSITAPARVAPMRTALPIVALPLLAPDAVSTALNASSSLAPDEVTELLELLARLSMDGSSAARNTLAYADTCLLHQADYISTESEAARLDEQRERDHLEELEDELFALQDEASHRAAQRVPPRRTQDTGAYDPGLYAYTTSLEHAPALAPDSNDGLSIVLQELLLIEPDLLEEYNDTPQEIVAPVCAFSQELGMPAPAAVVARNPPSIHYDYTPPTTNPSIFVALLPIPELASTFAVDTWTALNAILDKAHAACLDNAERARVAFGTEAEYTWEVPKCEKARRSYQAPHSLASALDWTADIPLVCAASWWSLVAAPVTPVARMRFPTAWTFANSRASRSRSRIQSGGAMENGQQSSNKAEQDPDPPDV